MNRLSTNIIGLAFGAMFGGVLAAGSLHEYDTIHNMLKLEEFYVFGFMGSAVIIATLGLGILESRDTKTSFGGLSSKCALAHRFPSTEYQILCERVVSDELIGSSFLSM